MIGKAVKAGVIALIVMNASWAAAFGLPLIVLLIFALLPVSLILAKLLQLHSQFEHILSLIPLFSFAGWQKWVARNEESLYN